MPPCPARFCFVWVALGKGLLLLRDEGTSQMLVSQRLSFLPAGCGKVLGWADSSSVYWELFIPCPEESFLFPDVSARKHLRARWGVDSLEFMSSKVIL